MFLLSLLWFQYIYIYIYILKFNQKIVSYYVKIKKSQIKIIRFDIHLLSFYF